MNGEDRAEAIEVVQAVCDEREQRYNQRFEAQQKAVDVALAAAEKAVEAALVAQEKAVAAALVAAEKAVSKAEAAAEKRFDAVNEFRGQQADIIANFLPRQEYDVQHQALEERVETVHKELGSASSAAVGNLNEKIERMRAEAVDRADVLRQEAADKIAQNFKESTGRIDGLSLRVDDHRELITNQLTAISERVTRGEAAAVAVQQFKGYLIGLVGLIISVSVFVGINTLR